MDLKTIDDLLQGFGEVRRRARERIWLAVEDYVLRRARLPIGRLSDDEDERRNILLKVFEKLERDDCASLRSWASRNRKRCDNSSAWGFLKVMVRHVAIDHARTSRLNVAKRDQPFEWVRVEPTAPDAFPEAGTVSAEDSRVAGFLARCTPEELREFLARLNDTLAEPPEPVDIPEPPFPARLPGRRDTNR